MSDWFKWTTEQGDSIRRLYDRDYRLRFTCDGCAWEAAVRSVLPVPDSESLTYTHQQWAARQDGRGFVHNPDCLVQLAQACTEAAR